MFFTRTGSARRRENSFTFETFSAESFQSRNTFTFEPRKKAQRPGFWSPAWNQRTRRKRFWKV